LKEITVVQTAYLYTPYYNVKRRGMFMYGNSALLKAYVCNVISTVLTDTSDAPIKLKVAKAAIGSIPHFISIDTNPFTSMVINSSDMLKQDPPSIQYEDGFELVNQWKDSYINTKLPEIIDTGLTVGDLIRK
jgi:hypothetical protein